MKCADCKFWKAEEPTDDAYPMGGCRRHAPRPLHESANALLVRLDDLGTASIKELEGWGVHTRDACWRQSLWPTTTADDFCGEFVSRKARVSYV